MDENYMSPFSVRYGTTEMRNLWSEGAKRRAWRRVWVSVAEAQTAAGLITPEQMDDIRSHASQIDLARAMAWEAQIDHDLMAELKTFAEQCPLGGGLLHLGLTSADVEDNADVVRQRAALAILASQLRGLLLAFARAIEQTAELPILGYTHLQPALPTTLGYRLSFYAQDLLANFNELLRVRSSLRGKGIKGAVGTSAAFVDLLAGSDVTPEMLESTVMEALGIKAYPVTSQVYPRSQDFNLICALAALAGSLHKFAFDVRLMQSQGFHLLREPFGESQVGSSAMPYKQNPIKAENICSLARDVLACVIPAWQNAANSLFERTLDDKSNRRRFIPEAFLSCNEMITKAEQIVNDMEIDARAGEAELRQFGPFVALERVLTALVRAGADRQETHERLRQHSMRAWESVRNGAENPLPDLLAGDTTLLQHLQPKRIQELLQAGAYTGQASALAHQMAASIRTRFEAIEGAG